MIRAPAAETFPISSCASSMERPVPSDCADTARRPAASSSVREARNSACTPPKNSITRRAFVGPKPGVSARASHCIDVSLVLQMGTAASNTLTSCASAGIYTRRETSVKVR